MRNPRITLQFVTRTLARLKHTTKLGPEALAYVLVKEYWGRPSQLEHLAQFLSETAGQMKKLIDRRCLACWASLPESRWDNYYCSQACRQRTYRERRALELRLRYRSQDQGAGGSVTRRIMGN
jgi:hypothetical protein